MLKIVKKLFKNKLVFSEISKLTTTMNTIYSMAQKGSCGCFVEIVELLVADAKKLKLTSNFDILQEILKNILLDAIKNQGSITLATI